MRVGVTVAVFQKKQILLTKRKDFQVWCLPGGQVETGESVTQAALRETFEETGLEVKLTALVGVYSIPKTKAWCNLIISFTACPVGGNLKLQESEVQEARYFHANEIPKELLWGQRQRIEDAFECNGSGVARLQNVPFDDVPDRATLYKLQAKSGLCGLEFYKTYFGLADTENNVTEIVKN